VSRQASAEHFCRCSRTGAGAGPDTGRMRGHVSPADRGRAKRAPDRDTDRRGVVRQDRPPRSRANRDGGRLRDKGAWRPPLTQMDPSQPPIAAKTRHRRDRSNTTRGRLSVNRRRVTNLYPGNNLSVKGLRRLRHARSRAAVAGGLRNWASKSSSGGQKPTRRARAPPLPSCGGRSLARSRRSRRGLPLPRSLPAHYSVASTRAARSAPGLPTKAWSTSSKPMLIASGSTRNCSLVIRSAAAKGASIFKMMDVSRHRSVDTLRGYVRDAEIFKDHAGAGLL
jgi:hypothetical protein